MCKIKPVRIAQVNSDPVADCISKLTNQLDKFETLAKQQNDALQYAKGQIDAYKFILKELAAGREV